VSFWKDYGRQYIIPAIAGGAAQHFVPKDAGAWGDYAAPAAGLAAGYLAKKKGSKFGASEAIKAGASGYGGGALYRGGKSFFSPKDPPSGLAALENDQTALRAGMLPGDRSKFDLGRLNSSIKGAGANKGSGSIMSFMKSNPGVPLGIAAYVLSKEELEGSYEGDLDKAIAQGEGIKGRQPEDYATYKQAERLWKAGDPNMRAKYKELADLRVWYGFGEKELQDRDLVGYAKVADGGYIGKYADGGYIEGYADGGDVGLGSVGQTMTPRSVGQAVEPGGGNPSEDIDGQIAMWIQMNGGVPTEEAIIAKKREWGIKLPKDQARRHEMHTRAIKENMPMEDPEGYAGGGYAHGGSPLPKQDDIPAMLSEGEFVFTKDAVDGAGGPQPLYEMMHQLEGRA